MIRVHVCVCARTCVCVCVRARVYVCGIGRFGWGIRGLITRKFCKPKFCKYRYKKSFISETKLLRLFIEVIIIVHRIN